MEIDKYLSTTKKGGFIGKSLESHVKSQVIGLYRSLVKEGAIASDLSDSEMKNIVANMTFEYIKDVLPDEVSFNNIGLFL